MCAILFSSLTINVFSMVNCAIDNEKAAHLAEALKVNTTLELVE